MIPMHSEKRLHDRRRTNTLVYISQKGRDRVGCHAVNLSSGGVGIKTDGLGLRVGSTAALTFVVKLGQVIKLHRRNATVTYVKNGVTGFHMGGYLGR